jgi:hypothetical protein
MCLFTDILYIPEILATWRTTTEQATKSVSYLQYHEWSLKIAQSNLSLFFKREDNYNLQRRQNIHQQLLMDFQDGCASALLKESVQFCGLPKGFKFIYLLFKQHPFYIFKKMLNRLSLNTLYSYPKRRDLAFQFIAENNLQWPPVTLETSSSMALLSQN